MLKPSARSPSLTSQESYSAVIIADLVAEVPVIPESEQDAAQTMNVKTNLAYDGHMDEASSGVNAAELGNMRNMKTNGAGISRGVILNAVQFGQQEGKAKGDEKPIQLSSPMSVQVLTQPISESQGFKDMSIGRKIAFGFSFLPSIMFVLCFAIILPCNVPKPCVEQLWLTSLNNTEIISDVQLLTDMKFTALEGSDSYLIAIDSNKGNLKTKEKLLNKPTYFNCGKILNGERDCIFTDKTGNIFISNSTSNVILWNPISENGTQHSLPVLLPDCNKDGHDDIAIAVSNTEIKVMFDGNSVSSFAVSNCDSVPSGLQSWLRENSTDLIFSCKKDGQDILVKVPQSVWCISDKNSEENITALYSRLPDSESKYTLLPTEDGLVMWSEEDILMLHPNGSTQWKTLSSDLHVDKNRFILHGKFTSTNNQVALLSSDLSSGLEITILDASNGSLVNNISLSNLEATEVTHIQGTEKDFAVVLLKKLETSLATEAMAHISDMSTKIVNYISNEKSNSTQSNPDKGVTEELAFLDLSGTHHSIKEISYDQTQGAPYKVSMRVVLNKEDSTLNIYLLRIFNAVSSTKNSEIRNIRVSNYDISAKSQQCFPKH